VGVPVAEYIRLARCLQRAGYEPDAARSARITPIIAITPAA
jgi:hypothetical protein